MSGDAAADAAATPTLSTAAVVGFVGAGAMGAPMIARLAGAGLTVRAYDTSSDALAAVAALDGCHSADSAAEAARGADCVITMLPNGRVVQEAVLAEGTGAVHGLAPGSILVEMSSSSPWETIALGRELRERRVRLVDAPVSGGVSRAREGSLTIVTGGDAADLTQVGPVLDHLGKQILHAGPLGAGHAVKALNNLLSATGFAATIESLRVAQAYGVDPEVFAEIVDASSGSNNTTRTKLRQFVLSRTFGSGFTIGLMAKDIDTAIELARREGVEIPLSNSVASLWRSATDELGSTADHTEYAKTVRAAVGRLSPHRTRRSRPMPLNIRDLTIRSADFEPGGRMADRHAREHGNEAPTLQISGVPAESVELAVICHDPDAPLPYGFTHWTLYGMPPGTATIGPDSDSAFRPGPNGYGDGGWAGPRPPAGHGLHHYYFWVYALDATVEGTPTREEFLERYGSHIVEQNRVIGTYSST